VKLLAPYGILCSVQSRFLLTTKPKRHATVLSANSAECAIVVLGEFLRNVSIENSFLRGLASTAAAATGHKPPRLVPSLQMLLISQLLASSTTFVLPGGVHSYANLAMRPLHGVLWS